ncbi:transporter substrate-binding domain-containing protein [Microbacterium sp.]|uniref:transporter substrate-binding domain-containing protein n=1 Tax=Microbacterium sp. TaxID=51671 RepID=UPI0035B42F44
MKFNGTITAIALLGAVSLALSGCSASAPAAGGGEDSAGAELIRVGTSVGAAPYEYYEEGTTSPLLGYEPDLLNEAFKRMGVEPEYIVGEYEALAPGLQADRFDMAMFGLTDRVSRQESFDMLDYGKDASGFLGREGTTGAIQSLDDICGKTVAVQEGSTVEAFLGEQSATCTADGNGPITLVTSPDLPAILLAVTSGRADYATSNIPLLAFGAQQLEGVEVGDFAYLEEYIAFMMPKDSELTPRLMDAIDSMIEDGTYQEILETWEIPALAIPKTELNQGTTP